MKKNIKILLLFILFSTFCVYGETPDSVKQDSNYRSYLENSHLSFKHLEGNGIGFTEGYSTIEAFISSSQCFYQSWLPYLDTKVHIFNNGNPAVNAGLGLRYLNEVSFGINSYYDYRKTKHYHYNQIGVGLEVFGDYWSCNINGYLPVGRKKSHPFDREFSGSLGLESILLNPFFRGHHLVLGEGFEGLSSRYKEEFSFKGIDIIGTVRVFNHSRYAIDLSGGPYYYNGYCGDSAFGGKFEFASHITEYISLVGSISYDKIFHFQGNGEIRLTIPLGKRPLQVKNCGTKKGKTSRFVNHYLSNGATRNEIIVVDKKETKFKIPSIGELLAINPLTGEPYFFWFVDNTSSSDGTFESPFPTLEEAETASKEHDVIYVFAGDGTPLGLDTTLHLKDYQRVLGAGMDHVILTTLGPITIPAQGIGMPYIAGMEQLYPGVVIPANNNEIAGFRIRNEHGPIFNAAIYCDSIDSTLIHHNILENHDTCSHPQRGNGLTLSACTGNIIIDNNVFEFHGICGVGIGAMSSGKGANYDISNNIFRIVDLSGSVDAEVPIEIGFGPSHTGTPIVFEDFGVLNFRNNQFLGVPPIQGRLQKDIGGYGVSGPGTINVEGNRSIEVSGPNNGHGRMYFKVHENAANETLFINVTNNHWNSLLDTTQAAVDIENVNVNSRVCVNLVGNKSTFNPAYVLDNGIGGTFTRTPETTSANNNGEVLSETPPISVGSCN